MKRDSSPMFEEEKGIMAAESLETSVLPATPRANTERYSIPSGMPQSVAEALADIEEGEKEFERNETFSHRDVMQMVWEKIDGYAGKIQ